MPFIFYRQLDKPKLTPSPINRKRNSKSLNVSVEDHLRVLQQEDSAFGKLDVQVQSKMRKSVGQRVSQIMFSRSRKSYAMDGQSQIQEPDKTSQELLIINQVATDLKASKISANPKDYQLHISVDEAQINTKLPFYNSKNLNIEFKPNFERYPPQ